MRVRSFALLPLLALAAVPTVACSSAPGEDTEDDEAAEVWDSANNPAYVDGTFVMEVAGLPLEGHTKTSLIPGDYWATQRDSVNVRWDGDNPSPAEELEQALGKPGLALEISKTFGIRAQTHRKECTENSQCADLKDGSSCAIPRGETKGRCIPGWWGICHGWAPYAFSEPAPVNEVTVNGVTFYPGDLEGLMSLAYSKNLPTKFISRRCNKDFDRDENRGTGRVAESECRDMNPGAMFVVLSNMLALRGTSLVEDRTFDDEVWNQPIEGFKVTNATNGKLTQIDKRTAIALLGQDVEYKEALPKTTIKKGEKQQGTYTAKADGKVVIRTNGNNDVDLLVNVGAEATDQANKCKSAGGGSNETCRVEVKAGDVVHWTVYGYAETSDASLEIGTPVANPVYSFNPDADAFYHVKLTLTYVTESRPARYSYSTPERLQSYLRNEDYEFILEAKGGRVVGGEWLGESMRRHPDFMWWPSAKPGGTLVAGIGYQDIKKIHDLAGAKQAPTQTETTLFENVKVSGWASQYATIGLKGGEKLELTMDGTGEADLYVRLGRKPTLYAHDGKSTRPGAVEKIELTAPPSGGTYWVRVRPMNGGGTVTVKAKVTSAS
jgi:hypothetical protein